MTESQQIFPAFMVMVALALLGCSSSSEESKEWEPQIDQVFRDKVGRINFARTHYPLARTAAMNRARNTKTLKLMRKTCHPGVYKISADKFSQTDFITLKEDYRENIQVRVYEFSCERPQK